MNRPSKYFLAGVFLLTAFCVAMPAAAEVVTEYEYDANRIYQVRTGLGITTQIELSPNEKIVDYSTGFSGGWDISQRENIFYLKPKNVDVDTNMVIRTETHAYIFELKVVATDWTTLEQAKQAGVNYKVMFKYPNDAQFSAIATEVEAVPEISTALLKDRKYNFEYDYSTSSATKKKRNWIIPASVYDDGQFTYVKMSDLKDIPTGNFPTVHGREREASEDFVVNTTVENNTIVVHGIYPYLVIRHGKNVVGLRRRK
jgi:type IV secretion system protein VirB9